MKKYANVKIISYAIIGLSVVLLVGLPIMFLFAKTYNMEMPTVGPDFVFSFFLAIFGIVSATAYLKRKKWSRVSLLACCLIYIATYIVGLISAYNFNGSISWPSLVAICICLYGFWYLMNNESKEWLVV